MNGPLERMRTLPPLLMLLAVFAAALSAVTAIPRSCVPHTFKWPENCSWTLPVTDASVGGNGTLPLCVYAAEWTWPQGEDFLRVSVSMADLGLGGGDDDQGEPEGEGEGEDEEEGEGEFEMKSWKTITDRRTFRLRCGLRFELRVRSYDYLYR
jgi:hypothetical protein